MNVKATAKATRDSLQQGIYKVINPLVKGMIAIGMTPNMVTTIGLLGNIAAAVLLVWAGVITGQSNGAVPYHLLTWAGALIIGFSLFDMLDGQVARIGGMASTFGAMYDSVLDRYCEMFTLGGISFFFLCGDMTIMALITYLAVIGSIMVSYVRARAEGLGLECKIGFMQRPERVVVTALGTLLSGILGQCGVSWALWPISVAVGLIAVFANLTAVARIGYVKSQMTKN